MSNRTIAEKHTDNIYDREILYCMLYMQHKANVRLGKGLDYVCLSYKFWMKRLPATRSMVTKALNRLREAGLIETKRTRRYGKIVLVIRIGRKLSSGYGEPFQTVIPEPIERLSDNQSLFINKKEENKAMNKYVEPLGFMPKPGKKNKIVEEEPTQENVASLPVSFDNARKVWSVYWHSKYDGPVDGFPASKKMRAMFKQWVAKVPDDQKPLQLIARAVGNWPEFREMVKHRTGKGMPERPMLEQVFFNLPSLIDVTDPAPKAQKFVPMKGNMKMKKVLAKLMQEHKDDDAKSAAKLSSK